MRVRGVQTHALLQLFDRIFVILQFAVGVSQVGQDGLSDPETGFRPAQLDGFLVISERLLILFLFVTDDSQFRINQRIGWIYFEGFAEG